MHEVILGLLPVAYYSGSAVLGCEDMLAGHRLEEEQSMARSADLRRVLMPLPGGRRIRFFLHWSDGTNLEAVDQKVIDGTYGEETFSGAVVGTDVPVRCETCVTRFRALVVEGGTPLVPNLADRLNRHRFVRRCPNCASLWRGDVLRVMEQVGGSARP
ncbi:hypothetical protein GL263_25990 [Streptomyces durbertensis]|uniref:Uncharacterized protein n=1 Tax=Streptomyces durbertensis TaxID=2448886 RepID=A0ABR6ENP2_9ACTN|nr:hypothetical protein [Streptomyces durbertensis]MBB1246969.1 hypothetical protein [Streptomyces durbertensis]